MSTRELSMKQLKYRRSLSFPELLPILSNTAANSALFITCEWSNCFTSLILLLQCWQATLQQHIAIGFTAVGMASIVCASSRHQKVIVGDVTPQEPLPEPATSPGQHNPFSLWPSACPAPEVTVNAVCHITPQFAQSSRTVLWLQISRSFGNVLCTCCLLSACCNNRANKSCHTSKPCAASRTNKLEEFALLKEHCAIVLKSYKLLPVGGRWLSPTVEQKSFPTTIKAGKMLKMMVYVHPVPEA